MKKLLTILLVITWFAYASTPFAGQPLGLDPEDTQVVQAGDVQADSKRITIRCSGFGCEFEIIIEWPPDPVQQ